MPGCPGESGPAPSRRWRCAWLAFPQWSSRTRLTARGDTSLRSVVVALREMLPARCEFREAAVSVCHIFTGDWKASLIEHPAVVLVQGIGGERRHQIPTHGRGGGHGPVAGPAGGRGGGPRQRRRGAAPPA